MAIENLITEHIDIWTSAVKTKSTSGRGSSKKLELYGVKKLRELILELAVQGKLVPQDPNDEPASVLLERISVEKAKLVKEKKIKKQKDLPAISDDELPYLIPENWEWCRLDDICFGITSGSTPPKSSFNESEGIPYLKVYNIRDQKVDFDYKPQFVDIECHLTKLKRSCLYPGDVIMNIVGPPLGKVAIISNDYPEWNCNQAITFFRPIETALNTYIYTYLRAGTFLKAIDLIGTAGQDNISVTKSRSILLPTPPLKEQHRIVAKVDELMALCDQLEQQTEASIEAHQVLVTTLLDTLTTSADADELMQNWARISEHFDTLFTTEESIDQLKQTILQLAVMGKLVPQDPSDEPAAELLKRIAEEKAQLVKEKKIKKQKVLPPIAEDEKPFELPNGWEWCRIQDVALFTTSGSRDWAKYYSDSGALFVTMGNLSRGSYELRLDNLRFVRPPKGGEGSRTKLEARDLLISITGDVGNLGLIPEEFGEAYINQHTCLLRFMPECQGKYFPDFMRSPLAKYQFDAPQRGIKNSFRLSDVGEMHLPLPPLNEQVRITEKVSDLLSICERLKVRLRESQITQLHLTDAIVERAV
ncbi:restriction endonuclease subunit S [Vibrio sp. 780]|uniref:restriction endonuclease subunit S n=1 Tax=unclassified Vibrio TaxID=2614977 RepID=UPI0029650303|nr:MULTISPECIES: restriction endonuclease subunit S [unclassified Vibrio]MDW1948998.1 restriction endonuclease subunit S [Vibrio sp. 812(2023)]MDW1992187.1 restriction endonuclease subunit S [Vibrio sp. 780]HCG7390043.1 restriction endonuclease subunit S [Vibrio parahaemolyticus]